MSGGCDHVESVVFADDAVKSLDTLFSQTPQSPGRVAQRGGRHVLSLLGECENTIARFRAGEISAIKFSNVFDQSRFDPSAVCNAPEFAPHASRLIFSVVGGLGYLPAGYASEADGAVLQSITPDRSDRSLEAMTTARCRGHTDVCDGLFPFEATAADEMQSPEIIALLCVRNPASVPTFVFPLTKILANLTDSQIGLLQRRMFHVMPQDSFARNRESRELALLAYHDNRPHFRYSNSKVSSQNPDAARLLESLHAIVQDGRIESRITLRPGDLLVINNRIALHGRETIAAKFDGSDRWLLRSYGFGARAWMMKTSAGKEDMFEF